MKKKSDLWQADQMKQAALDSIPKLDPRSLWRSPVMFAVEMGAVLATIITIRDLALGGSFKFDVQITIWLWFTILFANFAEALAEGRGRAQAETLKQARSEACASRLRPDGTIEQVQALNLRKGDRGPGKRRRHNPKRRRDL